MGLHVIVIGCGVAGLSCARLLQDAGHRVRIWAREQPPNTTSNIAAAFWYPYRVYPEDRVARWARDSFTAFAGIPTSAGVLTRTALELLQAKPIGEPWSAALPGARAALPGELPPGYAYGQFFGSYVIETPRYLPWLRDQFLARGGVIEAQQVRDLDEAARSADAVFHCSGLGARELVRDRTMRAVRGQLVRVNNPGIDRVTVDEQSASITYIVPRSHDVILGGTSDEGDEQLTPDERTTAEIVARCVAIEPRLRDATILGVQVGLRPCRPQVRVERELLAGTPVIHNYGHGGAGITLSWGCAMEALRLLQPSATVRP